MADPPRLRLARIPTPIDTFDDLLPGRRLRVKRDDLTGIGLSGNKIRKLDYLLHDALTCGASRVLTCGGIQSNHCRETAIAAARLGLKCRLFLRTSGPPPAPEAATGNLRLCLRVGADIRFVTPEEYAQRDAIFAEEAGPGDYVIPEGGSNALGAWGYIDAVDELVDAWGEPPSALLCAVGSAGTLAGLAIGLQRRGVDVPLVGVCVCDDAATFQQIVDGISAEATERWPELPRVYGKDICVLEGYVGRGYALSTDDEGRDIAHVARRSGLLLDPVYTGKAFRALLAEPLRFGDRPMFIHTGGLFGALA